MIEYILILLAYGAIAAAIIIFVHGSKNCGGDCNQGRKECDCDDEWTFK